MSCEIPAWVQEGGFYLHKTPEGLSLPSEQSPSRLLCSSSLGLFSISPMPITLDTKTCVSQQGPYLVKWRKLNLKE